MPEMTTISDGSGISINQIEVFGTAGGFNVAPSEILVRSSRR